jgi:hypothetical protein
MREGRIGEYSTSGELSAFGNKLGAFLADVIAVPTAYR